MDVNRYSIDVADREIIELGNAGRGVIEGDDIFELADLFRSDRRDDVLLRNRINDVLGRQSVGLQFILVEVDLNLEHLAAVGRGNRRAGDGRKLGANEVLSGVEYLRLRQGAAGQGQLKDRNARGVETQNVRRGDARGQQLEHSLRRGGDLSQRRVDVDVRLEEDLDDPVAGERLRLDMLDIVDLSAQRPLVVVDHAPRHVVRRQAVVGPHDRDNRNADIRKDVSWGPDCRGHAENDDQHRHDDESVWLAEGNSNDCEHWTLGKKK